MRAWKNFAITMPLAAGGALYFQAAVPAQSFDGTYKAVLNCAKLPFTDAPLGNEPVDLTVAKGKASYSRTLYAANRRRWSARKPAQARWRRTAR
jgi:hypothetical protein